MKSLDKSQLNLKCHTLKVKWNSVKTSIVKLSNIIVRTFKIYTNKCGKNPQQIYLTWEQHWFLQWQRMGWEDLGLLSRLQHCDMWCHVAHCLQNHDRRVGTYLSNHTMQYNVLCDPQIPYNLVCKLSFNNCQDSLPG